MATIDLDAGARGFRAPATFFSEDGRNLSFAVRYGSEKIRTLVATAADDLCPVGAYQEIRSASEAVAREIASGNLNGCRAGCASPLGPFKALPIAAGPALPKNITLNLSKE